MTDPIDPPQDPAAHIVRLASERAVRMSAVTPDAEKIQKPIVDPEVDRPSSISPYAAPLSFSWRDQPLDKKPPTR